MRAGLLRRGRLAPEGPEKLYAKQKSLSSKRRGCLAPGITLSFFIRANRRHCVHRTGHNDDSRRQGFTRTISAVEVRTLKRVCLWNLAKATRPRAIQNVNCPNRVSSNQF